MKRILFIAPRFHDYHTKIIAKLKENGYDVTFIPDISGNTLYFFIRSYLPFLFNWYTDALSRKKLSQAEGKYDDVFVIKGDGLPVSFWSELRKASPDAHFFMYQWDSLMNFNYEALLPFFDVSYTFDSKDAETLKAENVRYLPLFYDDILAEQRPADNKSYAYDFTFIGSVSLERYRWFTAFEKLAHQKGFKTFLFLYLPFTVYINLLLKGIFIDPAKIRFRSISLKRIKEVFSGSRIIIDIHSPRQTGLTMRTLEALGAGKKLITTNTNILKEPFYNEQNVLLFSPGDRIDIEKFASFRAQPAVQTDMRRYSLTSWLNVIIGKK